MKSLALFAALLVSVAGLSALALHNLETSTQEGEGTVEVDIRQLVLNDDQLSLDAQARINLPPTVEAGLDNGVPLTFVLDLQIIEPRTLWLDTTLFTLERNFRLTYYELTRHYRVEVEETDIRRNFRSLSSALNGLGELVAFEIPLDKTQAQLLNTARLDTEPDGALIASLSLRLSRSALPLPLQPIIRSSWTLVSEEYRWPVT